MCLCAVVSSGARFLTLSPPYSAHYREPLPKTRITSCREGPQLWPSSWSWWWIDYTIILALGNSLIQTWTSWAKSYSSASDHQPLLIPDAGHPALSVTTWLRPSTMNSSVDVHWRARHLFLKRYRCVFSVNGVELVLRDRPVILCSTLTCHWAGCSANGYVWV